MKLDNIRNIRHVSDLNAKQKEEMEKELDIIIPIGINEDPFHDDDNIEEDRNYEPSPKKFKPIHNSEPKSMKPRLNSGRNNVVSLNKKKLTPKERLLRLKKRVSAYKNASSNRAVPSQPVVNCSVDLVSNDLNLSMDLSKKNEIPENVQAIDLNHDNFFDETITEDVQNNARVEAGIEKLLCATTTEEILQQTEPSMAISCGKENPPLDQDKLIALMMKIEELTGVVNSLRRQIARIEAKSMINPKSTVPSTHASIDHSVFLDFEPSLAAEGFPILTCNGVETLDLKLKDTSYRQKLVRIFDLSKFS